jgi:Cdc6-like AAA superfamily ATPase
MHPECYHGIITITQIPSQEQLLNNTTVWLCNPFGNNYVPEDERDGNYIYGTHFLLHQDTFIWDFFLKEPTQKRAYLSATYFLSYLKELYPGLDGNIRVTPIFEKDLEVSKELYELVLPDPPFHKRANLIQKILNLFCTKIEANIDIFIYWSKADDFVKEIQGTNVEREYQLHEDYYKFKTFIVVSSLDEGANFFPNLSLIQSLSIGITNSEGESAKIIFPSLKNWEQLLKFQVFWKNRERINTGRFYQNVKHLLLAEGVPSWANAKSIDFTIPPNFLAPSAKTLKSENLGSFSNSESDIIIGNWVRNGVKENILRYMNPEDLTHHILMSGGTGTGKTYYCAYLIREIKRKFPHVGVLVINLKKDDEILKHRADITLKYGDEDFRVPYIFLKKNDSDISGTIETFVNLLTASIGLPDFIDHAMTNAMGEIYEKYNKFPENLEDLFPPTLKWFENKTRYDEETRSRAKSAIQMRAYRLLNTPLIKQIVQLSPSVPDWFRALQIGKNVFLDLSKCKSIRKKRLIVNLIMQMLAIHIPELKVGEYKLKYLILLDEASEILEELKGVSIYDDEVMGRNYIARGFSNFLSTYRSRGVALILTDQKPSRLYSTVHQTPMIKIIFRTPHSCSHLFSDRIDELDFIQSLEHRRALLIHGVKGYKYQFHTPDFKMEKRD